MIKNFKTLLNSVFQPFNGVTNFLDIMTHIPYNKSHNFYTTYKQEVPIATLHNRVKINSIKYSNTTS